MIRRLARSAASAAATRAAVAACACAVALACALADRARADDAGEAFARAALFEFESGRPDRAAVLADLAIRSPAQPGDPARGGVPVEALRFLRAEALRASGDPAGAAAERDALVRSSPNTPWARAMLDLCAIDGATCATAIDPATAPARGPLGVAATVATGVRMANSAISLGGSSGAAASAQSAERWGKPLETTEAAPFWLVVIAQAHIAARDTAAAKQALERAVARAAPVGATDLVSEAALRRAALAYHQGRYDEALTWVGRVTDEKGRALTCPAGILTGYVYYRLGKWKEAAQAFNFAQACAQDKGERGRLLALEARCRALAGERRLAAAVAGDAAQDLEAAARGEGIGQARLQDATDVLERALELDVDRQRLVRGFFAAQAAKEGWRPATAVAKGYAGFPFRVVRADDPSAPDELMRVRASSDSLSRAPKLAAARAAEEAEDRARLVRATQADLTALDNALASPVFAAADSAAAGREVREAAARLGERAATLTQAEASRLSGQARTLAAAARAKAKLAAPAEGQREERHEALDRTALEREADLMDATADSLRERAAREAKAWRGPFAEAMAREQSEGLSRRRAAAAQERALVQSALERTKKDLPLADAQSRAASAARIATDAAASDSLLQASRGIGPSADAAARTTVLRERARVDYEVALFERSAWAAIALDEGDSTEADLAPAIAASDEFLAKFPQSTYVAAAEFNRADLEVKRALAASRARGVAPDFAPAVLRYERLLAAHPGYARTDAVLFNLSVLAREQGDDATADRRLSELLQRSPGGELAAEAHVTLADRAFEAGRYDEAEVHYRAVANARGRLTPMALYKQGYSALRREDGASATQAFSTLLAMPDVDSTVANDAVAQLARALSLAGGAPAAERLFAATPGGMPPYAKTLLRTLAAQEKEDGAYDRAGDANHMLLERFPTDPGALSAATEMIAAWDARGRDDERIKARLDAGRFIAPRDSLAPPLRAFGAHTMLEAASLEHEKGRGGKDRAALERAVLGYRELAQLYPKYDSLALARTAEGEALYDLGRYAESATAHETALKGGTAAAAGTAAGAAGTAADLRREASFGSALARERVARGNSYRAPAERDSLERAIERFEKTAAGDPRVPPLWLSLAIGSQENGDSTRARRVYERVAGRDTSEASRRAQAELGRVALAERRWADAEKLYASGASAYLAAGDRGEEARLVELAASARFKQAEDLEAKRDTVGAARAFRTLADQYPNFTRADVALYRSGLASLAARDPRRAEEQLATLIERYPKSTLLDDATLRRGEAQLAMGDSMSAARTYANARLDGPSASQALAISAVEEAIEIYRAMGAYSDAEATAAHLRKNASDPRARTRAQALLAVIAYDLGRRAQTWQALAPWRASSFPSDLAPDPDADASARFVFGRILADSCLALPLAHPIQPALQRKLAVLGPALENLKAGAKTTTSAHWAESGYYAGALLDDLGARLESLGPPSKMSAEDSAGYRRATAGQAATFFGRAEDLWIATLEGLASGAPRDTSAKRDSLATRPTTGWPGRIYERLEPRLVAHYPWRFSIVDLPEADPATTHGGSDSTGGVGLVADLEGGAPPPPAAPRDSTALDAGAVSDLRNRLQWISQYVADGQIEEAAKWAEAGVKSYPRRAEIWNDLGAVRMRLGQWGFALAAWREALRLDPRSPGALYNRAVFERFYRLDREAARRDFERFLTLGVPFDETLADRMAEEKKP